MTPPERHDARTAGDRHFGVPVEPARTVLLCALLLVAAARIYTKNIPIAITTQGDFRCAYLASRAWAQGINPYPPATHGKLWTEQGGDALEPDVIWEQAPALYPPATLVFWSWIGVMPWRTAAFVSLGFNLLLILLSWLALVRMAGWEWTSWRSLLLANLMLLMGPVAVSLMLGQPSLSATAFGILALFAATGRAWTLGGILLGISFIVKPQVGGAFLLYHLLLYRWKMGLVAVGLFAAMMVIGIIRMHLAGIDTWIADLSANMKMMSVTGGYNDPHPSNPVAWHIVTMQYLLYAFFEQRVLVEGLTLAFVGVLCLWYWWMLVRVRAGTSELLLMGVPSILLLLPVYHRYYDSMTMIVPVAWAIAVLGTNLRWYGIAVLLCTAPFYRSFTYVFAQIEDRQMVTQIPPGVFDTWWWRGIVMPNQVWCLIAMSLILLLAMRRQTVAASAQQPLRTSDALVASR